MAIFLRVIIYELYFFIIYVFSFAIFVIDPIAGI